MSSQENSIERSSPINTPASSTSSSQTTISTLTSTLAKPETKRLDETLNSDTLSPVDNKASSEASQKSPNSKMSDEQYFQRQFSQAQMGNAAAQLSLGWCYANGCGVTKDEAEAVKWYRLAAAQENAHAQCNLAMYYANGRGVTKDEAEAVKWYRRAAEQRYAHAEANLGVCYANGRGVTKDEVEAVKWYRLAAAQKNAQAQCNLGWCYANGRGVTKDEAEAVKWYRLAAEQKYARAQVSLGLCYENGRGVAMDLAEAMKWYKLAAVQGNTDAQARLDTLENSPSTPSSSTISDPSSVVDDREMKESKQIDLSTEVSQLTADIQQGDVTALSKVLTAPVTQQSQLLQNYLQSQAIWTVLESEAKPAQKAEQIALLVEAPGILLLAKNEQHQLPLDRALQQFTAEQMNKTAVEKLQEATYRQVAEKEGEVFNAIEEYAKSISTDVVDGKASSRPVEAKSIVDPKDGSITPQQLAAEVQKLRKADASLHQQFKAISLPVPQPSASSSQPRQLSRQQRNLQKKLFQQTVQQLVSKKFIKSVAIGQSWVVETVSTKKAAIKAGVTFVAGTIVNVFLPGMGGMVASGAKAAAETAERRHQIKKSRQHTLGLTSLNQLAMVTNYIEQSLLHRYQDFLLQQNLLLPQKAMETLVNCLIERMCLYVEKVEKSKQIVPLFGEKFINLNKQKKTGQAVISDSKFTDAIAAQIAENLVAGTSLLNLSLIDSLLDKVGSGTDALITCLTAEGHEKELRVNDICHSPAVTLTAEAEKASLEVNTVADDLEYEGRHLPGSQWIVSECGVMCVSRMEAESESLHATTPWSGGLPLMKEHSDVAKWRARANTAEAEVITLRAKVSGLEHQLSDAISQRSSGQQLAVVEKAVEAVESQEPKSSASQRLKGGSGMFDSKPIRPLPPVAPPQPAPSRPKLNPPSGSVTSTRSVSS